MEMSWLIMTTMNKTILKRTGVPLLLRVSTFDLRVDIECPQHWAQKIFVVSTILIA